MNCAKCGHNNPEATKLCGECGARLESGCAACGAANPPGNKFCGECGAPLGALAAPRNSPASNPPRHLAKRILQSRPGLEGERKQVTVLFADMKGSMELLADRDPEEARKLLDPVLERMMEAVHAYEGTVNQVMGDGIMALFGAPVAHEDHAIRACYAALRMQNQIARFAEEILRTQGLSVQVRIGINSGEVVVRSIGSDLHMDYTAVGQTTHLAARMEQIAAPGTAYITGDTLRLAEGYVDVKPLGPVPVKGLSLPIEVYELTGAGRIRSRLRATVSRGLTPFVGRVREMESLQEALARAQSNQVQIVALVGEPGVGKSRLVHEFVHTHGMASWLVLESSSASFGHATPYLPVIELLKNYFKIDVRDSTRTIREKITGKILTLDAALQETIAPMLDLLDALPDQHPFRSLDPLQHRQQTYQAVTRLLLSESRVQPAVAIFEDLQWNDSLTLGLLDELVETARDARLMLLVSYRPEHQDAWRGRPNYRQLRLEPLAPDSLALMLSALLGSDATLAGSKDFLLHRAGGNPFFLEEIVRNLIETGVILGERGNCRLAKPFASVHVPPTIQAVLAARIDRLAAPEKRLLQEAAVIGFHAPFALLLAISGLSEDDFRGRLAALQAAEFVYVTQLYPELRYTFKHALTHEVVYSGLLSERRRDIHARIVVAMERLYADRIGEQVERLAEHAVRGQLREKALTYLRQAGTKAAERHAYREAVVFFEQALAELSQLPESRETLEQAIDIRFDIRNSLQPLGDREQIAAYLREAEPLAARLADPRRIGWIQSYLTENFWMLGRQDEAAAAGERALEIARRTSELSLQVVTNLPLGLVYHTCGDYRRAIETFQWNADHLGGDLVRERFGMFVLPALFSRSFICWALAELGEFGAGVAVGEEAVRIAEEIEHPFSCGYARLGLGVLFLRQGDLRRAISHFERALAVGAFADSPVGFSYVAFHLGYALTLTARTNEGIGLLEKTVAMAESMRFVARHSLRLAYLGEALLVADRHGEAAAMAERALALAREHGERANEAYALRVIGEVDARGGRLAEAEARFNAALSLAGDLGMRPLRANCHWGLSRVLEAMGKAHDAVAHREAADALCRSMDMRIWLSDTAPEQVMGTG